MKVALALPYLRRGFGIEHRTLRLAGELSDRMECVLLCARQDIVTRLPVVSFSDFVAKGILWRRHSWLARRALQHRYRAKLGRDWILDAQYCPMTALRPKGPFVVTWYSVPPLEYAESGGEARAWEADRRAMLEGARRADLVLCISEAAAQEIQTALGPDVRTEVLHIGCDTPATTPSVQREGRRILSLARFAPHKCHEDTLAAAALARRALPGRNLEVVLCGTAAPGSPYLESLKSWAASLGLTPGKNAHFVLNATPRELALLLASSDVFVSSSRWEGFGMPLVEAQGAGLPAVAYRLWSHPEVVASPEHLFDEGDVGAMADTIIGLLEDETTWRKASELARAFVQSKFAWSDLASRYVDLLAAL